MVGESWTSDSMMAIIAISHKQKVESIYAYSIRIITLFIVDNKLKYLNTTDICSMYIVKGNIYSIFSRNSETFVSQ